MRLLCKLNLFRLVLLEGGLAAVVEARSAGTLHVAEQLRQPGSLDPSIASASAGIRLTSTFACRTFSRCMAALLMPVLLRAPSGGDMAGACR